MATTHDNGKDAYLNYIADNATHLHVVSDATDPANVTNTLGNVALTAGAGNGDFVIAAGDTSGRKLSLTAQSITASGTGTTKRYVIWSAPLSLALAVQTHAEKGVTNGSTYDYPAFDILEVRNPVTE